MKLFAVATTCGHWAIIRDDGSLVQGSTVSGPPNAQIRREMIYDTDRCALAAIEYLESPKPTIPALPKYQIPQKKEQAKEFEKAGQARRKAIKQKRIELAKSIAMKYNVYYEPGRGFHEI